MEQCLLHILVFWCLIGVVIFSRAKLLQNLSTIWEIMSKGGNYMDHSFCQVHVGVHNKQFFFNFSVNNHSFLKLECSYEKMLEYVCVTSRINWQLASNYIFLTKEWTKTCESKRLRNVILFAGYEPEYVGWTSRHLNMVRHPLTNIQRSKRF